MRTLTPTLLAAQRSLGGVPSLRVRIEDRERRWAPLVNADTSACPTAACATAIGIVRARISAAGTVDVQRVTAPAEPLMWQGWSALADACPGSSVAVSAVAGAPQYVRLFYLRPSDPAYAVARLESIDGGVTWSAPEEVVQGLPGPEASLASANGGLLYHDPADGYLKLAECSDWGGPWMVYPWSAAGALPARYGIAACYLNGTYYVACSDREDSGLCRLRTGTCTPGGAGWSAPVAIVPPGVPSAAFRPIYPSLACSNGGWHLAYIETSAGALAYARPIVIHSPDWERWSFACWVPLDWFGECRGAALVHHRAALYLSMEDAVWSAADYDPAEAGLCLETADVLGYTVEEEAEYGRALVEVHNPAGRYDRLGEAGHPGAPIRPLARLVLERGFRTEVGEERIARAPYYIVDAAVRRGGARPALRLECEDGWGLLRRWRPDALYVWTERTIAWLIAQVLYRAAGVACAFDNDAAWGNTLESFVIAPPEWPGTSGAGRPDGLTLRSTGLGIVQALLAKAAGCARWQAGGSLYCFVPWSQSLHNAYITGSGGEILDALYGHGLAVPNEAQVFGDSVAGSATGLDPAGSPRRYLATAIDPHLRTSAECSSVAAGLVHAGRTRRYTGWVETPCQCGLELYDLIRITDPRAGSLQGRTLRAAGILERYNRDQGTLTTRITFEHP